MRGKQQPGQVLETLRVVTDEGEHTLGVYYYPTPRWYGWRCDNGDCETGFKTEADARADLDVEIAWLRGEAE